MLVGFISCKRWIERMTSSLDNVKDYVKNKKKNIPRLDDDVLNEQNKEFLRNFEDDGYLMESCVKNDIEVHIVDWLDDTVDWTIYDFIIIRSCWNYHENPKKFIQWLDMVDKKTNLVTNVEILKWNVEKFYLKDLVENSLINIPPTLFFDKSVVNTKEQIQLEINNSVIPFLNSHYNQNESNIEKEVVIKPSISASSYLTQLFNQKNEDFNSNVIDFLETILIKKDRNVLIQPKINEIVSIGEYSFIYLSGNLSHVVLKTPKSGDFRSQSDFGGLKKKIPINEISSNVLLQIQNSFNKINNYFIQQFDLSTENSNNDIVLPYARIDGFINVEEESFHLIELELLEPELFFKYSSQENIDNFLQYLIQNNNSNNNNNN
eukprot:TRINITY_DN16429_c0_g1_i1.p1 TRINITY_DN16429_c0_g1~~TRINITY_DN16429_c0_g1_i1.p1  ORF type:complete len:377 (+),score=92.71 TRINITY_DN16429_c0_g1_i1:49-1179(+)